ncbi:MAG TPA: sigma-70 family RNA polymerase sigma factor [Ktedonobacterales bacterium]|nr:sigma-70 family RNA polymerase sigma factor [Ktedonobacterales bacterium]
MSDPLSRDEPPEAVFEDVLAQSQASLINFARGLVGDWEQARDITQDTFVAAWRSLVRNAPPFDTLDDMPGIRRWLFTVAYRQAIKHLRRRRVIAWEPLDDSVSTASMLQAKPSFEDAVADAETLRLALLSVGPEDAACFLLQAAHGFSAAEVAAILDIRTDTLRKRFSRARQRLRDAYNAQSQASGQPEQSQPRPMREPHGGRRR